MRSKNIELQTNRSYHYVFVGFIKFKEILKKLSVKMPYYKFTNVGSNNLKEIFYDVEGNMLSDAGIVLSKSITKKDTFFNVRRLSRVSKKKYKLDKCEPDDNPKDFAVQIADAIEDSFSTPLSIDLESIVKKTKPIISLDIDKTIYEIVCGTGYKAKLVYEDVEYRDIKTGKKIRQEGATLVAPIEDCEETEEILNIIERNIAGLSLYNASRFEIAQKLLYSNGEKLNLDEDEETEE